MRDYVRIKIISLSVFDVFSSINNLEYLRPNNVNSFVDITETCKVIKKYNFTLRVSINMTNLYEKSEITPEQIFQRARDLGVNQITFRVLYYVDNPKNPEEEKINNWILENKCSDEYMNQITDYIKTNGTPLEKLSFGAIRYSVDGLSCVIDDNCMGSGGDLKEDVKYFILRPDCKLYTRWSDSASLLF